MYKKYDHVGFIPDIQVWFNIQKNKKNDHINSLKKNHVMISTDAEETSDRIQHSFTKKKKKKNLSK